MSDSEKALKEKGKSGFLSMTAVRDILVVLILAVLGWKLALADIVLNFEKFGFAELLATLLAFFAIGLSVAFYFKATDTSNTFYDNVYHFTKDTSEILGRIEAGFGERLRHLDEGYSGLRERFDRMPFDVSEAKEEAEKEEQEVQRQEEERFRIIEDLAQRAQLAEGERESLFAELRNREKELMKARRELSRLQRRIDSAESFDGVPNRLTSFLLDTLGFLRDPKYVRVPSPIIRQRMKEEIHRLPSEAVSDMQDAGLVDDEMDLTRKGLRYLRELALRNE